MMKRIFTDKGDSKLFYASSLISGAFYVVWLVSYIVCLILRSAAFNSAQSSMALGGYSTYTVEVTSPFFGVLEFFAFLIPVLLAVWTVMLFVFDRKGYKLCNNVLIYIVYGAGTLCAVLCALDIAVAHMIF